MGVREVISGIGKGSLFQYGRFLGVHNPFGSDLGKARDPFINLYTLGRLSHTSNLSDRGGAAARTQVVNAVAANMAVRLSHGQVKPAQLKRFSLDVLLSARDIIKTFSDQETGMEVVKQAIFAAERESRWPLKKVEIYLAEVKDEQELAGLKRIQKKVPGPEAFLLIADHPLASRRVLFQLCCVSDKCFYHPRKSEIFERIKNGLSTAEIDKIAIELKVPNSYLTRDFALKVLSHPRLSAALAVKMLDRVARHYEFRAESPDELDEVRQFFTVIDPANRPPVLAELAKTNPKLAQLLSG
jgi:hypothetical protein